MILILRIENYDMLDDGGPTSITLNRNRCSVGRKTSMDWVLPDPGRHISSHHFDVEFRDGAYWLTDVSMNGTFLMGQQYRLDGPHRIQNEDRFVAGHYIISAELREPAPEAMAPVLPPPAVGNPRQRSMPPPPADDADPWAVDDGLPGTVDPMPHSPRPPASPDDIGDAFVPLRRPNPAPFASGKTGLQRPPSAPVGTGMPGVQTPAPPPHRADPALRPAPYPPQHPQFGTPAAPGSAPHPSYPSAPPASAPVAADMFLKAFCDGAGIPCPTATGTDSMALARELGRCVRIATEEMRRMLDDRANVKLFTKGHLDF